MHQEGGLGQFRMSRLPFDRREEPFELLDDGGIFIDTA
jgi:hypothetical protein